MKKKIITMAVGLAVAFALYAGLGDAENDSNSVKWNGKKETEKVRQDVRYIEIPGISQMVFVAGETSQRVNIHNPESNDCDIVFTLSIDNEAIWKSGKCEPGFGYYDIEIAKYLDEGTYQATLLHECYRGKEQLNSAKMNVEIIVQNKENDK